MIQTKEDAIRHLKDRKEGYGIRPGETIYVVDLGRSFKVFIVRRNKPLTISGMVARAVTGLRFDQKTGGVRGTDNAFDLVYHLGRALFPNGGPLSKSPRRRQEEAHGETREKDGGYLLRAYSL